MNPYMPYREPERQRPDTFGQILAALKLGLDAYGTYQQGNLSQQHQDLAKEDFLFRKQRGLAEDEYRTKDIDLRRQDVALRGQQIAQTDRNAPEHNKQWGTLESMRMKKVLSDIGFKDKEGTVFPIIDEMAKDSKVTKGVAYDMFKQGYQELKEKVLKEAVESYVSKMDKPEFVNSQEGQRQLAAIERLQNDLDGKVIDDIFQRTRKSLQQEEAMAAKQSARSLFSFDQLIADRVARGEISPETASSLLKPRQESGRLVPVQTATGTRYEPESRAAGQLVPAKTAEYETWGQPTTDEQGNKIQKSSRGQVRVVTKAEKPPSDTEQRMTAKDIADAEAKILENKSSDVARGEVDFFNQHAAKPYAYTWKPGKLYGGDWGRIDLPKINGKQVTAKDVYDTAETRGMTYEEVLRAIGALK